MKTLKYLLASALCVLVSTACSGNKQKDATPQPAEATASDDGNSATGGKTLVVYFSHAGENYSVGNVEVGNTKVLADYISAYTGAPQFEVVCTKDYNMDYKSLCDLAKKEQEDGELPSFVGGIEDMAQYDTVFVGAPVWWGTWPQVMFTFFKTYDMNGKTLIPFTTHEGSGLGRCVNDLKAAYPQATVTGQFSMYGHDVRSGKQRVEKWLKQQGF